MAENKKKVNNTTPLNYEDKINWTTKDIEQNPDFANNPKAEISPITKKVVQPAHYRNGDLDDYAFGDDVRMNSREGYDWTDTNGNQHSLYSINGNRNGSYHSITDKDGNRKVYYYNGHEANSYIPVLYGSAKKAWKQKLKNTKNGGEKTPTTTATTIIGENLKLGGDTKISGSGKLGKSETPNTDVPNTDVPNTGSEANKLGSDNNGGTTGDTEKKGHYTQSELNSGVKSQDVADEIHDGTHYESPYQTVTDNRQDRELMQDLIENQGGSGKGIYGILPAFLFGEYGNYHLPKYKEENNQHFVTYNGKKMRYDTKEEAMKALKELKKQTRSERAKAWAQFLYHTLSSIETNDRNMASDLAGQGRPYKSSWQTEIENRQKGNNELYYDNEKAKSANIRSLESLADRGIVNINNLTNEQVALFIAGMGKERAMKLLTSVGQQQINKYLAEDWAKNWSPEVRNAYISWASSTGALNANDTLIALASGQVSPKDIANKWATETSLDISKRKTDLDAINEAIKSSKLANKMTEAQVAVIKELVAEQLKAAQLSNADKIRQMATSSVDSIAKIIDAIVPM